MSQIAVRFAAALFGTNLSAAAMDGAIICTIFFTALAVVPVLKFLWWRGWSVKRQDIFSSLSPAAKANYLKTFVPEDADELERDDTLTTAELRFKEFYYRQYGKRHFIIPSLFFVPVCFVLMLLFSETAIAALIIDVAGAHKSVVLDAGKTIFFIILDPIAAAGIIGAYMWVVADFVASARQNDLHPTDLWNATLRMSVAGAMGFALGTIVNASVAPFVAFAVGAFPMPAVRLLFRRLATKQLSLDLAVSSKVGQITELDGIDQLTADRLQEYGITTVPNLAYCDPVHLSLRTGLTFDFISDTCAQALAWNYIGADLKNLKQCGLRTSVEIANLFDDLKEPADDEFESAERRKERAHAKATLTAAAKVLYAKQTGLKDEEKTELLRHACGEIADDPYTVFLRQIWDTRWDPCDNTSGQDDPEHTDEENSAPETIEVVVIRDRPSELPD